eukprot:CAMPEP_0170529224 /NCGR_PEP_ID=MMETSP0209-20121228/18491_1 /TAXON_ID=665100 ORGANISM="Litonotus pictus, Strain P1" /NCGR_SAMPLE_ID=MMETSP0209 /ASSEMBLY_ACC=CAM_ASM_000301 /LENGTH=239 /DNA_ID=CAMNT_0010820935 /DNA_START=58 /DNA_END=777 /DNA_ORIENTATION=+
MKNLKNKKTQKSLAKSKYVFGYEYDSESPIDHIYEVLNSPSLEDPDKINSTFDLLDSDKNGELSKEEGENGIKNICKEARITKRLCKKIMDLKPITGPVKKQDFVDAHYNILAAAADTIRMIERTKEEALLNATILSEDFKKWFGSEDYDKIKKDFWKEVDVNGIADKKKTLVMIYGGVFDFEFDQNLPLDVYLLTREVAYNVGYQLDEKSYNQLVDKVGEAIASRINKIRDDLTEELS